MKNPWLDQIYQTLPRLLSLFDTDPVSPTRGLGDRYRWAWKLIDFSNGTFQGAAHGLARLVCADLLPPWLDEDEVLEYIDLIFHGTEKLIRPDNSLEEAFPHESSFCVTALVAFDLLSAVETLNVRLAPETKRHYLVVIKPLISYLNKSKESHAFISNHLATAAAALYKWELLTGEKKEKAQSLLESVLKHQSSEGWYLEYEGADPGYMSLCLYYLADIYRMTGLKQLKISLENAIQFLLYAAHPDGSFGGEYGSRNTRFYYPGGVAYMARESPCALSLHRFMSKSIEKKQCVGLLSMDEPNLVPMFNSYAWGAVIDGEKKAKAQTENIPSRTDTPFVKYFKEAGIAFVNRPQYYLVMNTHKGGSGAVYYKEKGKQDIPGVLVSDKKGRLYTTQLFNVSNCVDLKDGSFEIRSTFSRIKNDLPSPTQFLILRLLCLTLMRIPFFSKWIKKTLVHMLITGKKEIPVENRRMIKFNENVVVEDEIFSKDKNSKYIKKIINNQSYRAYHMASSGYWQRYRKS